MCLACDANGGLHAVARGKYGHMVLPLSGPPGTRGWMAHGRKRSGQLPGRLRGARVNGVLIGETLMRSADKKAALDALRGAP